MWTVMPRQLLLFIRFRQLREFAVDVFAELDHFPRICTDLLIECEANCAN